VAERSATAPRAADVTRAYLEEHPSIRTVLQDELINYPALARKIQSECGVPNEEAVSIACRRIERSLRTETPALAMVRALLGRSRLEVHSRVALIRLRNDWAVMDALMALSREALPDLPPGRVFEIYEGTPTVTVLCEEDSLPSLLPAIPKRLVLTLEHGLASLVFRSLSDVSETPGVLAYMTEALYRRGINCLETVSVHSDSIFVFRNRDLIRAYETLSALLPRPTTPRSKRR
jgi:hypothetical protein